MYLPWERPVRITPENPHTPNAGRNLLFQCFSCQKAEKGRDSKKIEAKLNPRPALGANSKNRIFA